MYGIPMWRLMRDPDGFVKNSLTQNSPYPMDLIENYDGEGDDANLVSVELNIALAGIPKSNINVNVKGNSLLIHVDKTERVSGKSRYKEIGIKKAEMSLEYSIASGIDKDSISSKYENGLLKIILPLVPEEKARTITIK